MKVKPRQETWKKKFKGLLASLSELALTIFCLNFLLQTMFSANLTPFKVYSYFCWLPTYRPTGVLFFSKTAARFSGRLGALGTKVNSKMARCRHGFSLVFHRTRLVAIVGDPTLRTVKVTFLNSFRSDFCNSLVCIWRDLNL